MLYRRNCNTLLSSSLQRCYINGVCFAFQLAALWKIRSVICPWEHQLTSKCKKQKKGWGTWTWWADLGIQIVHNTHTIWDNEKEKPMNGGKGWSSHLSTRRCHYVLFTFHVKQQSCFPPSPARKPISCRQSIKPNQQTAIWLTGQLVN